MKKIITVLSMALLSMGAFAQHHDPILQIKEEWNPRLCSKFRH